MARLSLCVLLLQGFPNDVFCGIQKGKVVLNSSQSEEVVLKTIETAEESILYVF